MEHQEQVLTIQDLARTLIAAEHSNAPGHVPDDDELRKAVRTIRYYMDMGLLPRPLSPGKAYAYHEGHRERLRLIRLLNKRGVSLKDMADQIGSLDLGDIRALLREEEQREASVRQPRAVLSPRQYIGALLDTAHASHSAVAQRATESSPRPGNRRVRERPVPIDAPPPAIMALADAPPSTMMAPADTRRERTATGENSATLWRHVTLAPGVVLQYAEDGDEHTRSLVESILHISDVWRR